MTPGLMYELSLKYMSNLLSTKENFLIYITIVWNLHRLIQSSIELCDCL
jgi:hypothetical protein